MKHFRLYLGLVFFISFCSSVESFATGTKSKSKASEVPTRIRSDIIDIKRKSQTINFLNNVVVEKGDSSLLADRMKVFYDKKQKGSNTKSEIKRIEAFDNVKIFSEEFVGSSDFGFYDPKDNVFVLEKNVIINNGTSIASGDKFIYDLTTKKGQFVGKKDKTSIINNSNDKRVLVIIGDDISKIKESKKDQELENE